MGYKDASFLFENKQLEIKWDPDRTENEQRESFNSSRRSWPKKIVKTFPLGVVVSIMDAWNDWASASRSIRVSYVFFGTPPYKGKSGMFTLAPPFTASKLVTSWQRGMIVIQKYARTGESKFTGTSPFRSISFGSIPDHRGIYNTWSAGHSVSINPRKSAFPWQRTAKSAKHEIYVRIIQKRTKREKYNFNVYPDQFFRVLLKVIGK